MMVESMKISGGIFLVLVVVSQRTEFSSSANEKYNSAIWRKHKKSKSEQTSICVVEKPEKLIKTSAFIGIGR